MRDVYPSGSVVEVVTYRPKDITIDGVGMLISGTSTRYIEIIAGIRCTMMNLRFDSSLGSADDVHASFDEGGFLNRFINVKPHGGGAADSRPSLLPLCPL